MGKRSSAPAEPRDGSFPRHQPPKKSRLLSGVGRLIKSIFPSRKKEVCRGGFLFFLSFQGLNTNQKAAECRAPAPLSFRDALGDNSALFLPSDFTPRKKKIFFNFLGAAAILSQESQGDANPTISALGSSSRRCLFQTSRRKKKKNFFPFRAINFPLTFLRGRKCFSGAFCCLSCQE